MGRIQSNIGLITGMPIGETVDKLMALAAKPKDMLVGRTTGIQKEQAALTSLAAALASVQYVAKSLGKAELFQQRSSSSSNSAALVATLTGNPALGSYQFTPLRMVQSQQWLSSGVVSSTAPLGAGTATFRFGPHVETGVALELLGGGAGFQRGKIRITDRSGASAEIDLSSARSLDDVLTAINDNTTVNVTAVAQGDRLRLIDHTGQTVSNLKVQEIGGGGTAASLGLAGIDVADTSASGQDMLRLYADLDLASLNDRAGVQINASLADLEYTLRDGTTGTIDLSPIIPGGSEVDEDKTLGDVLARINAAAPEKLKVEIAPDGERLVATDLTTGSNTFSLSAANDSSALADLGLDGSATDGVITGRRLMGGLQTVLLASLNGGKGLGPLGTVVMADRRNQQATADLSECETLQDVLDRINDAATAAGAGITARVNAARNGIELVDTTGEAAGQLVVSGETAEKLGLDVSADVTSVNSGDLHLRIVSPSTRLASLNGGAGVATGLFTIIDSAGGRSTINVRSSAQTVGDVIREINHVSSSVRAEINDTGDGIVLRDLKNGSGPLTVQAGSGTTAKDLHLLHAAQEVEIDGQTSQAIDGSMIETIELGADDSLEDLRAKINGLSAGLTASILSDGSTRPYRLSLTSQRPGVAGELVMDFSGIGLALEETVHGQDALLALGSPGPGVALMTSSTNKFTSALPGVTLEVKQTLTSAVTVTVATSDSSLVANVKTLVDNYNKFRDGLAKQTAYNAETNEGAVLFGNATALRLDTDLSYLLSGRFAGAGPMRSIAEIGLTFNDDGTLEFDESRLKAKYASDPDAVKQFFTTKDYGFAGKLDRMLEQLSGPEQSLLMSRLEALDAKVAKNQERIEAMEAQLERQRERLYMDFYRMELAIGKLQDSLGVVQNIQPITPLYTLRD